MSKISGAKLLETTPAFSSLPVSSLEEIASRLKEEHFLPGNEVIRAGDPGDRLFIITSGRAEVRITTDAGPVPVATLSGGELFGEISLLKPGQRRSATVLALSPLTTLTLTASDFKSIISKFPEAHKILDETAEKLLVTDFLKSASPFRYLKPDRLRLLAEKIGRLSLNKGEIVVREGERGGSCFLVRKGRVEVVQKEDGGRRQLSVLGAGSLFGETALLTESPRNATVRTLEETELLELKRVDFIKIVEESRELRHGMFELLSLRDQPHRLEEIEEHGYKTDDASPMTILVNRRQGSYYRLPPQGYFIWKNLDGRHNLKDLTLLCLEKFGLFAPHSIAETISGLVTAGFAESRTQRAAYLLLPQGAQKILLTLHNILSFRIMLRNIDHFFGTLYRYLSPLFSRIGVLFLGTVSLAGLILFLVRFSPQGYFNLVAILLLILSGPVHEAGHALAVKAFGRKVLGLGIGWNWITPILFVDTSDMWLASRWQRVLVSLAGPSTHLILGGISSCLSILLEKPGAPSTLWFFTAGSYLLFLMNLLPILDFDGHYVWRELREQHCRKPN